jgi:outer membrane protein assembly factor BamB
MKRFISLAALFVALIAAAPVWAADATNLPSLWELQVGQYIISTPAIDPGGNVYVTVSGNMVNADVSGGKLVCANSNGVKRWSFSTRCDIKSSPAISDDGTIYFGARDRKLYSITPGGKLRWSFTTGAWVDATPAISSNGVVYCGSWDQKFYALNPNGTKQWEFATDGPIDSSAAIAEDGTIYFGSHDKKFYALKPDGSVKWTFTTDGAIISSPALNCDGTIYFTSVDGRFYVLNPDGSKKSAWWTGGTLAASPVLDGEGNIYIGVNNTIQELKPDGTKKWLFGYPPVEGSAALAADGTVYFGGVNEGAGVLYGFNPEGVLLSYTIVPGGVTGSATIAPNGMTCVGGYALHAFKGPAGLAKACWPKFHGGLRQTGRLEK